MNKENDICIYCNNTGRTYDNPDMCTHCGRTYQRGNIGDINEISFYIPPSLKELVKSWSPLNVKEFVQRRNSNLLPKTQNVLDTLYSITFECKEQIIFNISIYNYQIILNSWSAYIFIKFSKIFNNISTVIYNPLLLDDIFIIKDEPLVIMEIVELNWESQIQKVLALISVRKRLGKPTFVFSNCRAICKFLDKKCVFNYSINNNFLNINDLDDLDNPFIYITDL